MIIEMVDENIGKLPLDEFIINDTKSTLVQEDDMENVGIDFNKDSLGEDKEVKLKQVRTQRDNRRKNSGIR
jgi:hypothetical protein